MSRNIYLIVPILLTGLFISQVAQAQNPDVYNESGSNFSGLEKIRRTIQSYTDSFMGIRSYDGDYYYHKASEAFARGHYTDAITEYNHAIRYFSGRKSKLARTHYQRGLCWYITGEYDQAIRDFNIAIAYRPDVTDSYYFRGKVNHLVFENYSASERDFDKVLALSQRSSVQTAFARYFLGDERRAHNELQSLLSSAQSSDRQSYAQLHYTMAGLQSLMGHPQSTVEHLQNAIDYGYREYEWLARDLNFRPVASSPVFQQFLRKNSLDFYLTPGKPVYNHDDKEDYQTDDPAITLNDEKWDEPDRNADQQTRSGPMAPASLKTREVTFKDSDGNNRIDAGESTTISFVLRNNGPAIAQDLMVRLMEESRLEGLEYESDLDLGSLSPDREIVVELPVRGSIGLESGKADFTIQVLEKNGFDADNLYITIPTQEFMPPRLEIVDYHFASELGGKMRQGVPITLKMAVQNTGSGDAEDVALTMSLPENVFSAGAKTFDIGDLRPGQSQIIDFEFFTNKRYNNQEVPIIGEITESYGNYGLTQTLTVAINQQLEVNDRVVINAKPDPTYDIRDIRLTSDVDKNLPRSFSRNSDAVAVVIGNRDYENPDVPPVDFALQDAASVKKYLIQSYGFDEENIIFLPNATQADFNGIFGKAGDHKARLFNLVKPDQSDVFIFYSGHGAPDIQTEEAYFVPVDCDPSLVRFNGYAIKTFYENLSKIQYKSLTVVIDACFSGSSDRGTLIPQASLVRIKSGNNVLKDPKAMVFTSASGTEIASWYPEQSHSLFTYYFLKGLQGEANTDRDRTLTLEEMRAYISENVPYMARRMKNRVQTPEIYGQNQKIVMKY